jgi:hypothetical protein
VNSLTFILNLTGIARKLVEIDGARMGCASGEESSIDMAFRILSLLTKGLP